MPALVGMCRSLSSLQSLLSVLGDLGAGSVETSGGVVTRRPGNRSLSDCLPSLEIVSHWSSTRRTPIILIISTALVARSSSVHHWLLSGIPVWYRVAHLRLGSIHISTGATVRGSTLAAHYIIEIRGGGLNTGRGVVAAGLLLSVIRLWGGCRSWSCATGCWVIGRTSHLRRKVWVLSR